MSYKTVTCRKNKSGMTLLEILIAVTIMGAIMLVAYMAFYAVSSSWQRMNALTEDMHHGDFVMDQVTMALRSAYYPNGRKSAEFGFVEIKDKDGVNASDKISWVKVGSSIVGRDCPFEGTPHRIEISLEQDDKGEPGIAYKAWRLQGQAEDFDPDKLEPVMISKKVVGFNVRTAYKIKEGEIDWLEKWEDINTNKLPLMVEITLKLAPIEKGNDPIEIKRICTIPTGPLSW